MKNQPEPLKTYKNRHETIKNQSRTIKTNPGLYRVVRGGSGGYRRLPGGCDDFSLQTHTHCIIIYISSLSNIIIIIIVMIIMVQPGRVPDHHDVGDGERGQAGAQLIAQDNCQDCNLCRFGSFM